MNTAGEGESAAAQAPRVSRVEVEGHVVIVEAAKNRRATADKAVYDLKKSTITLSGQPRLEMEQAKIYNAETIEYDLNSEKFRTTGKRPVVEYKTGQRDGEVSFDLFGSQKKTAESETSKP